MVIFKNILLFLFFSTYLLAVGGKIKFPFGKIKLP